MCLNRPSSAPTESHSHTEPEKTVGGRFKFKARVLLSGGVHTGKNMSSWRSFSSFLSIASAFSAAHQLQ